MTEENKSTRRKKCRSVISPSANLACSGLGSKTGLYVVRTEGGLLKCEVANGRRHTV